MAIPDIINIPRGKFPQGQKVNYGKFALFLIVAKKCGLYQLLQKTFPRDYKLIFAIAVSYLEHNQADFYYFQEYEKTNYTDSIYGTSLADYFIMLNRSFQESTIERFNQAWMKIERGTRPLNENIIVSIVANSEQKPGREIDYPGPPKMYSHLLSPESSVPLALFIVEEPYCSEKMFEKLETKCSTYGFKNPLYLLYDSSPIYPLYKILPSYRYFNLKVTNPRYEWYCIMYYDFRNYLEINFDVREGIWSDSLVSKETGWKAIGYCFLSECRSLRKKAEDDFSFLQSKAKKITIELVDEFNQDLNFPNLFRTYFINTELYYKQTLGERVYNLFAKLEDKYFRTFITNDLKSTETSLIEIHKSLLNFQETNQFCFEIFKNYEYPSIKNNQTCLMFIHFLSLILKQEATNYLKPILEDPYDEDKSLQKIVLLVDQIQIKNNKNHWSRNSPMTEKQKEIFQTLDISENEFYQTIFCLDEDNQNNKITNLTIKETTDNLDHSLNHERVRFKYGRYVLFATIAKECRLFKVIQDVFPSNESLIFEVAQFMMTKNIGEFAKLPVFLSNYYVGQQSNEPFLDTYRRLIELVQPSCINKFNAQWSKTVLSRLSSEKRKEGAIVILNEMFEIKKTKSFVTEDPKQKSDCDTDSCQQHFFAPILAHASLVPIALCEYHHKPSTNQAIEIIKSQCIDLGLDNQLYAVYHCYYNPSNREDYYNHPCLFLNLRNFATISLFASFVNYYVKSEDYGKKEFWSIEKNERRVKRERLRVIGFRYYYDYEKILQNMDDPVSFKERQKLYSRDWEVNMARNKEIGDYYDFINFKSFKPLRLEQKLFYRAEEYFHLAITNNKLLSHSVLARDQTFLLSFVNFLNQTVLLPHSNLLECQTKESDMYLVFLLFLSTIIKQESINFLQSLFDRGEKQEDEFEKILRTLDEIEIEWNGERWVKSSQLTEEQENILRFMLISEKNLDNEISQITFKPEN